MNVKKHKLAIQAQQGTVQKPVRLVAASIAGMKILAQLMVAVVTFTKEVKDSAVLEKFSILIAVRKVQRV